ncbi:MAG: hypothetical protein HOC74_08760, partial [Gemmatimonadetes bacterium]|nr:hypothetical protein [Gemmatimonadota bacterium]
MSITAGQDAHWRTHDAMTHGPEIGAVQVPNKETMLMPLFDYVCKSCDHAFETLIQGSEKPLCPSC